MKQIHRSAFAFPVWNSVPFFLTLLLVLLGQVPLFTLSMSSVSPALALIAVYYWTIHRPDLMPMLVVFLLGLLDDFFSGAPLGLGAFTLLVCRALVVERFHAYGSRSFWMLWWGFLLSAVVLFLQWIILCILEQTLVPVVPVFFSWAVTVALFPVLAAAFQPIHRRIPETE